MRRENSSTCVHSEQCSRQVARHHQMREATAGNEHSCPSSGLLVRTDVHAEAAWYRPLLGSALSKCLRTSRGSEGGMQKGLISLQTRPRQERRQTRHRDSAKPWSTSSKSGGNPPSAKRELGKQERVDQKASKLLSERLSDLSVERSGCLDWAEWA